MKKYMVALVKVELCIILEVRTANTMEEVRTQFDDLGDVWLNDWLTMSDNDKECYFDCHGYQDDSDYMVQWFELDANGNFDNKVRL